MHKRFVGNIIARILFFVSIFMLLPLGWAVYDNPSSPEVQSFLVTIIVGLIISGIVLYRYRITASDFKKTTAKDGLAIVGLSWIILSCWGALPLFISRVAPSFTDAFFEIVSGFTTTGASIFGDVESIPKGILLWRSLTHWLGGMGIIVLFIAILPILGSTSSYLYKVETSGLDIDRAGTHIRTVAKQLWIIYAAITAVSVVLLMLGKMPFFDALCHTFGAIATGGFSTKNSSIGFYGSYIQWVIIGVMFLGGINFTLFCYLASGKWKLFWKDSEMRMYIGIIICAMVIFFFFLKHVHPLRDCVFQIISVLTTTGYTTADFSVWPSIVQMLLLMCMFIGGCAGSTGGGMKIIRVLVSVKAAYQSIVQSIYSHAVVPVRYNGNLLQEHLVKNVLSFVMLYLLLFAGGTFFLLVSESCDIITAVSASIASLSNVGPGLSQVGPMQNYSWVSVPGKWMLSFMMIAGRLELYTVLALLLPSTWKK